MNTIGVPTSTFVWRKSFFFCMVAVFSRFFSLFFTPKRIQTNKASTRRKRVTNLFTNVCYIDSEIAFLLCYFLDFSRATHSISIHIISKYVCNFMMNNIFDLDIMIIQLHGLFMIMFFSVNACLCVGVDVRVCSILFSQMEYVWLVSNKQYSLRSVFVSGIDHKMAKQSERTNEKKNTQAKKAAQRRRRRTLFVWYLEFWIIVDNGNVISKC